MPEVLLPSIFVVPLFSYQTPLLNSSFVASTFVTHVYCRSLPFLHRYVVVNNLSNIGLLLPPTFVTQFRPYAVSSLNSSVVVGTVCYTSLVWSSTFLLHI